MLKWICKDQETSLWWKCDRFDCQIAHGDWFLIDRIYPICHGPFATKEQAMEKAEEIVRRKLAFG